MLSDGTSGIFFRDNTKMVVANKKLAFIERAADSKKDECSVYDLASVPDELSKRYQLVNHFKGYMSDAKHSHSCKESVLKPVAMFKEP